MSAIHDAFGRLIIDFREEQVAPNEVRVRGAVKLGSALEGPPARLHGGHHAFVRTFPILRALSAHDHSQSFPCEVDVVCQRGLALECPIPFEATFVGRGSAWQLHTRFDETDRLDAWARSSRDGALLGPEELTDWGSLYDASSPADESFEIFGVPVRYSERALWIESYDPLGTNPESQHGALVEPDGTLGPAFVSVQVDTVGASARGTMMRHPHFTKRIEIRFATGSIPADTHLLCIADRTRIKEDEASDSAPVLVKGELCGTVRVPVVLVDAAFETAYATGTVTAHPVDAEKFEQLQQMRQLRTDR